MPSFKRRAYDSPMLPSPKQDVRPSKFWSTVPLRWLKKGLSLTVLLGCWALVTRWIYVRLRPIRLELTDATTPALEAAEVTVGLRRIVISDLHLGAGDRLDDFAADGPFAAFMQQYVAREPTELILAGDTFEFLQVRIAEVADDEWSESAAVARLNAIVAAHPIVMGALVTFIANPAHQLTIMIGNHDFELHYRAVKRYLQQVLGGAEAQPRLRFAIRYRGDGIYIVHGNQFDRWNRFINFEGISEPFEVVRGTQLVKEIYNDLEDDPLEIAPLLDNVKPSSAFFWYLVALPRFRQRPIRRFVLRGVFRLIQMLAWPEPHQMPIRVHGPLAASLRIPVVARLWRVVTQLRQQRVPRQQQVARQVSEFASNVEPLEPVIDQVRFEANRQMSREIRDFNDRYAHEMARLAKHPDHATIHLFVCGHTHLARVVPLDDDRYYVNTGTWTKIIYDIKTMRQIEQRYPFLEITYPSPGNPVGRLLVWQTSGEPPKRWYDELQIHTKRSKLSARFRRRATRRPRRNDHEGTVAYLFRRNVRRYRRGSGTSDSPVS